MMPLPHAPEALIVCPYMCKQMHIIVFSLYARFNLIWMITFCFFFFFSFLFVLVNLF